MSKIDLVAEISAAADALNGCAAEVKRLREENARLLQASRYNSDVAGSAIEDIQTRWVPLLTAAIALYGPEPCSGVREPEENCERPCELCDLENAIAACEVVK